MWVRLLARVVRSAFEQDILFYSDLVYPSENEYKMSGPIFPSAITCLMLRFMNNEDCSRDRLYLPTITYSSKAVTRNISPCYHAIFVSEWLLRFTYRNSATRKLECCTKRHNRISFSIFTISVLLDFDFLFPKIDKINNDILKTWIDSIDLDRLLQMTLGHDKKSLGYWSLLKWIVGF